MEDEEASVMKRKPSIWENFDISRVSNVCFKLKFITLNQEGESPVCEIELEDISSEIAYWRNVVVCCVFGARPPFSV
ncbi:hypothetical protein P3S67_000261 [Capsicum chacoense]